MPQNSWSLLVFTLLSQTSVGAYCVAEFLNFSYSKESGAANLRTLRLFSRLFVLGTAILAGVSSIFHLKNWAHAYYAFNNLKTSWVSKEMLFFFLFIACVASLALMSWRKNEDYLLQRGIAMVGVFCGIALISSMARIYMLPAIPVWDAWTTPALFFTATFLLGSLAVVCLYTKFLDSSEPSSLMDEFHERWSRKILPTLVKLLLIFIVVCILVTVFFVYQLIEVAEEHGIETSAMRPDSQILFSLRILLYVLGWVLLLLYLKKSRLEKRIRKRSQKLLSSAFIFIALAEIVGRYLFYVSFYRIGL